MQIGKGIKFLNPSVAAIAASQHALHIQTATDQVPRIGDGARLLVIYRNY